jgi:hypothetical protein
VQAARHSSPRIIGTFGNAIAYEDQDLHLITEPML